MPNARLAVVKLMDKSFRDAETMEPVQTGWWANKIKVKSYIRIQWRSAIDSNFMHIPYPLATDMDSFLTINFYQDIYIIRAMEPKLSTLGAIKDRREHESHKNIFQLAPVSSNVIEVLEKFPWRQSFY